MYEGYITAEDLDGVGDAANGQTWSGPAATCEAAVEPPAYSDISLPQPPTQKRRMAGCRVEGERLKAEATKGRVCPRLSVTETWSAV